MTSSQSVWMWFADCQNCGWRSRPFVAIEGARVAGSKHEQFDRHEAPAHHTTEVRSESVSTSVEPEMGADPSSDRQFDPLTNR